MTKILPMPGSTITSYQESAIVRRWMLGEILRYETEVIPHMIAEDEGEEGTGIKLTQHYVKVLKETEEILANS